MIKNYLKIAIRNILKHKTYSIINITGLVMGMVCFLLVMLWVEYEFSYDKNIPNADRIYRLGFNASLGGTHVSSINIPGLTGKDIMDNYPEVEQFVRFSLQYNSVVNYGETLLNERELTAVDQNVFKFFNIPMISGDPNTALSKPYSVCISEKAAKRYFGNENPLGKILTVNKKTDFIITGVFEDFPDNCHIDRTLLASFSSFDKEPGYSTWDDFHCITYLLMKNPGRLSDILKYYDKKITDNIKFSSKSSGILGENDKIELFVQKLADIHLYSNYKDEFKGNGSIVLVYIFISVAVFILLLASINFINLSTAKSMLRAKEVAIRKTIGSDKKQLIKQFLGESILYCFIAMVVSLIIIELFLPGYRNLLNKNVNIHYLNNFYTIPFLVGLTLLVGILSGIYPAFILSSFKPAVILKGKLRSGKQGSNLRGNLVVFQFAITIIFITGTFVIKNQLEYVRNKYLGFDRENVIVLYTTDSYHKEIDVLREKLLRNSSIISVSNAHSVPGHGAAFSETVFLPEGKESVSLNTVECDYDYLKTFNMQMAKGRFFSREFISDSSSSVIINETAAKMLGWNKPIGKYFKLWNQASHSTYTVIGVVKDFNFESLHRGIRPMAMILNSDHPLWLHRFTSIRIKPGDQYATLDFIRNTFKEVSPSLPFRYSFLDERYNRLYNNDVEIGNLFTVFSLLAILVACLGLLGLVTFATERRTKEVAVRKIFGANISELFLLLSKESIIWVILANIFAWPIAYYLMSKWLENYAYRVEMGIFEFLLAGFAALVIALITVSFQVYKIARSNPVDSLKYE
jgi:putative ABC transport system permease protein